MEGGMYPGGWMADRGGGEWVKEAARETRIFSSACSSGVWTRRRGWRRRGGDGVSVGGWGGDWISSVVLVEEEGGDQCSRCGEDVEEEEDGRWEEEGDGERGLERTEASSCFRALISFRHSKSSPSLSSTLTDLLACGEGVGGGGWEEGEYMGFGMGMAVLSMGGVDVMG